jgi:hypothetical protein
VRTLKSGQSKFFVGYKKHTFRCWLQAYEPSVQLIPLLTWVTPANVSEGRLLRPSIAHITRRWGWCPEIVVADMGYIDADTKRQVREQWRVAVVTRLKEGMVLIPPFERPDRAVCPQGQTLQWLGYEPQSDHQWFGVQDQASLCPWCWEQTRCAQQFGYRPAAHETLLGLLPMNTLASQRLLQQVRPWIEPAQSFEKNQLGLSQVFFNSLRLAWTMSLLADAAVLLRAQALLELPRVEWPMFELTPQQLWLDLE